MSLRFFYTCERQNAKPVNYILSVGPANLAVSLAEVKTHLKITGSSEDAELTDLINAATEFGEKITGRDFINKTYITYLNCFPFYGITIQKSKTTSITSIEYFLSDVLTTFDSSNYYLTDDTQYASIYLFSDKSWPDTVDDRIQAVKITFVSGYGVDETFVPELIKRALLAHIASLYENRGDCSDCSESDISKQAVSLYKPCILQKNRIRII